MGRIKQLKNLSSAQVAKLLSANPSRFITWTSIRRANELEVGSPPTHLPVEFTQRLIRQENDERELKLQKSESSNRPGKRTGA